MSTPTTRVEPRFKLHWHVLLVHFPVAFFTASFIFIAAHFMAQATCFELAGFVMLVLGAASMAPTTLSGWLTWKHKYHGMKGKLFLNKIGISIGMLGLSAVLIVFRLLYRIDLEAAAHDVWHYLYLGGITLLVLGAVAEGYYGGRLNHR